MQRGHTPSCFAAGALIGGKYRLVRQLGEGGMGVVWSAVNGVPGGRVGSPSSTVPGRPAGAKPPKPPASRACTCDAVPKPPCCEKYAPDGL